MKKLKFKLKKKPESDSAEEHANEPVVDPKVVQVELWSTRQLATPIKPREGRTNERVLTFLGFDSSGKESVYRLKTALDNWEQWAGFTHCIIVEETEEKVRVILYEPVHSFLMLDESGKPLLFEVDKKELR